MIEVQDPVIGPLKLVGDPIHMTENKPILDRPSPTLGQHTDDILKHIGYTEEKINALRENGVI